jgi:branched-chain amino acid transport system permease protein
MRWVRGALVLVGLAIGVAAVIVVPARTDRVSDIDLAEMGVFFIAILGLNIVTGYTGQISLGHGAFMAVGGYTTAILMSDQGLKLGGHVFSSDLRDIYTLPIAGAVAGLAGVLFGIPALRLSGLYLALATFAVAVALPSVLKKADTLTGGSSGINLFGLPRLTGLGVETTVLGRTLTFNDWLYYLSWTIAVVLFLAAWLLVRGRTGRALRAIRDSEVAAASSGVHLATYKTLAFGVSAFYAGIAGGLFAIHTTFVNPDTFPISLSIFLLVGIVVGGLGSLWTLVFGAALIVFLPDVAQRISKSAGAPSIVYAVVLIAAMFVLPTGVGGLVRRLTGPLTTRLYTRA